MLALDVSCCAPATHAVCDVEAPRWCDIALLTFPRFTYFVVDGGWMLSLVFLHPRR